MKIAVDMRMSGKSGIGTFLDEIWSELPDAWADVGSAVLPLPQIKKILMENAHE